jgi:hypothetical protein
MLPDTLPVSNVVLSVQDAINHNLPRFIIIDCSGFNYVDVCGTATLCEIVGELNEIHVEVKVYLKLFFKDGNSNITNKIFYKIKLKS